MTTFYEEMRREASTAHAGWLKYEQECTAISREVLSEIRTALGWPEGAFQRLTIENAPGAQAPGGWFDKRGKYYFSFRIVLDNAFMDFNWCLFREKANWFVGYDNEQTGKHAPIDRAEKASLAPLVAWVKAAMAELVETTWHPKRWQPHV